MKLASLLIAFFPTTAALAAGTGPEWQVRALMVEAINSTAGRSQGQLHGPLADAIQLRFRSQAPIHVQVTTLRRYSQPGCSRLNVRFRQDGVVVASQPSAQAQTLDVGIDYCRDGSAPVSRR